MRMAAIGFLVAVVAGCGPVHKYGEFGNFPDLDGPVAADTARQIETLYPPGSTRISLGQKAMDGYGQALLARLRHTGYAVFEFAAARKYPADAADRVDLRYVVDSAGRGLYRVSVLFGDGSSLNRAYAMGNDRNVQPATPWCRRE